MFKCILCNKELKDGGSGSHLRKCHNISSKEYYDTYLKKKSEGICIECGLETKFESIVTGYKKYCCQACANNSTKISKEDQILICQLYEQNWPIAQIAIEVNHSIGTVKRVLRKTALYNREVFKAALLHIPNDKLNFSDDSYSEVVLKLCKDGKHYYKKLLNL